LRPLNKVRRDLASTSRSCPATEQPIEHECPCRGRTQWDAMAEATSQGRFRATRLALLIFVRYWPSTGAGALTVAMAYKLIAEVLSHHR
jgi:hypothetical protein